MSEQNETIIGTILISFAIVILYYLFHNYVSRKYPRKKDCNKPPTKQLPKLLYFIINDQKTKGDNMNTTQYPSQEMIGAVEFPNRKGQPAKIQAGTAKYKLRKAGTEETIIPNPATEKQFIVRTTDAIPDVKELWDVYAEADADPDEDSEKIISGIVLGIVYEALPAVGVAAATIIKEPTDIVEG